jgi:hypothetical protein
MNRMAVKIKEASLIGETIYGLSFIGTDDIKIVPKAD